MGYLQNYTYIIYTVYLLIPGLLLFDFLDLLLLINRNINSINEIEKDLEELCKQDDLKIEEVMRLVSEYNCIVSSGIATPNWIFKKYHNEIQSYWDEPR